MKQYAKDAWHQLHVLLGRYTKEWKPRPDLRVTAHATDRNVEVEIGDRRENYSGPLDIRGRHIWHSAGNRSVGTMRELAACIVAACDFVDESNPEWASHGINLRTPDEMVKNRD